MEYTPFVRAFKKIEKNCYIELPSGIIENIVGFSGNFF